MCMLRQQFLSGSLLRIRLFVSYIIIDVNKRTKMALNRSPVSIMNYRQDRKVLKQNISVPWLPWFTSTRISVFSSGGYTVHWVEWFLEILIIVYKDEYFGESKWKSTRWLRRCWFIKQKLTPISLTADRRMMSTKKAHNENWFRWAYKRK